MPNPRDLILAQTEDGPLVPLKGYAGAFIRKVSIGDADAIASAESQSGLHLMVRAVCDKDGNPIFTIDDVEKLSDLKVDAFRKISAQISAVNQMGDGAPEDLVKN